MFASYYSACIVYELLAQAVQLGGHACVKQQVVYHKFEPSYQGRVRLYGKVRRTEPRPASIT